MIRHVFRNWGEDERNKTDSVTGSQNNCSGSSPATRPANCSHTRDSERRKGQTLHGKERSDVSGNQQVLTSGQQTNSWSQESLQVEVRIRIYFWTGIQTKNVKNSVFLRNKKYFIILLIKDIHASSLRRFLPFRENNQHLKQRNFFIFISLGGLFNASESRSTELTRGPPELVQHFRLQRELTSAKECCMSYPSGEEGVNFHVQMIFTCHRYV